MRRGRSVETEEVICRYEPIRGYHSEGRIPYHCLYELEAVPAAPEQPLGPNDHWLTNHSVPGCVTEGSSTQSKLGIRLHWGHAALSRAFYRPWPRLLRH